MPNAPSKVVSRITPADLVLKERDQRLESLKGVVGKLAHDFNNFLVPMLGYVTLIKEELASPCVAVDYATALESSARKSESDLEAILLAMRPQRHFSPKILDFSALLSSQIELWKSKLNSSAGIELNINIVPCSILADERHWTSAIQQMLGNAHYALAMGGKLEIMLASEILTGEQLESLGLREREVFKLTVRDCGFGMSQEVLRRAFEPFYTTRTLIKAPGLGLTIIHSVVHLHGGQVVLESEEDKGTALTIWIPAGRDTAARNASPWKFVAPLQKTAVRKVMFVESDPVTREVLRGALQKLGLEVHAVQTGEEAFKAVSRSPDNWALLITEEIEVLKSMRALRSDLSAILFAGEGAAHIDVSGKTSVLRKPFALKDFNETVLRTIPRLE